MPAAAIDELGLAAHPRVRPGGEAGPGWIVSENPTTAEPIAAVRLDDASSCEGVLERAFEAFVAWREVPAPVRGQAVRAIGEALREHKRALGELIGLEVGKIRSEGEGEVQETIDIADFAVGLSRQLYGLTMPSERPEHRMEERWHPLGPIGVITAFNFPNAVWGWNAMVGAVCGDAVVWKPSLLAPLTAIATNEICSKVLEDLGHPPIFQLVIGADDVVGERVVDDRRLPLISATGSCGMGRAVGERVARRLGRCLLELGGNNAVVVEPDADMDLALKNVLFSAIGTCGQRCTTTRRLLLHESIAHDFLDRLSDAYRRATIGDPLADGTLVGPLISARAMEGFHNALVAAREQGGEVLAGGERARMDGLGGYFVQPTIVRAPASNELPIAMEETFAPILYAFTYRDLEEALSMHNSVAQGLSSSIFTGSVQAAERFTGPSGSDCGLAYINLGTCGAEIGGAFGGEKETGGGRESGSDAWKAYMRRQTVTINGSSRAVLAQGIRFD